MKSILTSLVPFLTLLVAANIQAQEQIDGNENPAHQELRRLRDGLLEAMNKGDLDGTLKFLHTNCVITWHNAEVSRGHEGVRAYHNRVMTGPDKIVESFTCTVNVDELTTFYSDSTGICFGSSDEQFKLANGRTLQVKGRWTATLIREDGSWLVTSLHASTDLFDNAILDMAKGAMQLAALVSVIGGGIVGWLLGRRRPRSAPAITA